MADGWRPLSRRRRDPMPLEGIIRRERDRLWKNSPGLGLQSLWSEAAGPEIAACTHVSGYRDGVMTVACTSSAWSCELKLLAGPLLEKLNAMGPAEPVREIRFVHQSQKPWKSRK